MIKSFVNRGLKELSEKGGTSRIGGRYIRNCQIILTMLADAEKLEDLNRPSFRLHKLNGKPTRYSMDVNQNYRVTFEWDNGAVKVDFEDTH